MGSFRTDVSRLTETLIVDSVSVIQLTAPNNLSRYFLKTSADEAAQAAGQQV